MALREPACALLSEKERKKTDMWRIILLAIGYCFGLFQTGYLYGRMHGIDIRQKGSGNSGATNTLRVLGVKAGLIVFLGDMLKTFLPCLAVRLIFGHIDPEMEYIYMMYTGIGVVLGHNYPFYLGFRGGKGIAATAGLVIAMDWKIVAIGLPIFILVVAVTRFVSLGSILVVAVVWVCMVIFGQLGFYHLTAAGRVEFYLLGLFWMLLAIWRHRSNIKRLLSGTENKLSFHKQPEA